ncbi:MAG: tetratricopeptide repeat protein, partial [Acidobacteriota bacterium]
MDHLRSIFKLYYNPAGAMSDLIDSGSWMFAAGAVLVVAIGFFATVNAKLDAAYRIPQLFEYFDTATEYESETAAKESYDRAAAAHQNANSRRASIPVIGDRFFQFFSFSPAKFYDPIVLLSLFYVPTLILLMSIFGGAGSFGIVLRRDYGTLAACTLTAWAAAHLPFALAGLLLFSETLDPRIYLAMWTASSLIFGVFMVFALRTVMGATYPVAILIVGLAWLSLSLGTIVTQYVSPWLFSPFLLIFVVLYFGRVIGGELRGFGDSMRQKQNLKRFLHSATVNPRDADAHVQLALIYLQRRQEAKAVEHLTKALEIDEAEIDANYEMGKIERTRGNLQQALNHFSFVVEQNDKHAVSEVWREIGVTYFAANMLNEAHDALEKFTIRRSADVEGLYHFGKVLKAQGKTDQAREVFEEAIQNAKASPDFRRRGTLH